LTFKGRYSPCPCNSGSGHDVVKDDTQNLLVEMQQQEEELEAILAKQRGDELELGRIRDAMSAELAELKKEAWRMEALRDLEDMKGKLDKMLGCDEGGEEAAGEPAEGASLAAAEEVLEEEAAVDSEIESLRQQLKDIKLQAQGMEARRRELMREIEEVEAGMPERWDAGGGSGDEPEAGEPSPAPAD